MWKLPKNTKYDWLKLTASWRTAKKNNKTVFLLCIKATLMCCPLGQRQKIKNRRFLDFQLFYITGNSSEFFVDNKRVEHRNPTNEMSCWYVPCENFPRMRCVVGRSWPPAYGHQQKITSMFSCNAKKVPWGTWTLVQDVWIGIFDSVYSHFFYNTSSF